jgi:hypothetical protein
LRFFACCRISGNVGVNRRNESPAAMPLALSDAELAALMTLSAPIEQRHRAAFVEAVAEQLNRYPERGDGLLHRVARELQRDFVDGTFQRSAHQRSRHR